MDEIKIGPNQINIPHCMSCVYCGKMYKTRKSLDNHVIVCEIMYKTKRGKIVIEDDEIPSQKIMYQMILELTNKCIKLEEKVDEFNKWIIKKKRKINILDWLNSNRKPSYEFEKIIENIDVNESEIDFLFNNSFNDTLNEIFLRNFQVLNENQIIMPIFCISQKQSIYVYSKNGEREDNELSWKELSREKFVWFLNQMFTKIYKAFIKWGQKYKKNKDDSSCILYDKTMAKIMNIDFKLDTTQNKLKSIIYAILKTDFKALMEYELEF
jgi:hypothetical protein